jgi:UDP-glucose 4-epimerase
MKILITGGAGYIGNELSYRLAAAEEIDEIVVYDNLVKGNYNLFTGLRKLPKSNISFVRGDILDSRKLAKTLEDVDVVYHLAAYVKTPFASQNPHSFEQTNNWGTAEVVQAVEEAGIKRFIHLSSLSVYGFDRDINSVDDPANPKTIYGASKLHGEEHVQRLLSRLPTYILRCANVYGYSKNLRIEAAINRMLFDAHFGKRITIHSSGQQRRAFISIKRVVDALYGMLDTELSSGAYNLVDKNITINDVGTALSELYPGLEMIFVDQRLPTHDIVVRPDERLDAIYTTNELSLVDDLTDFRTMFTF